MSDLLDERDERDSAFGGVEILFALVTLVIGFALAMKYQAWITLFSATLGILAAIYAERFFKATIFSYGVLARLFSAAGFVSIRFAGLYNNISNRMLGRECTKSAKEAGFLFKRIVALLYSDLEQGRDLALRILFTLFLKPLTYYARWGLLGMLLTAVYAIKSELWEAVRELPRNLEGDSLREATEGLMQLVVTRELDFALGGMILIIVFDRVLSGVSRDATNEATELLPDLLLEKLRKVQCLELAVDEEDEEESQGIIMPRNVQIGMSVEKSAAELSDRRAAIISRSYQISQFFRNTLTVIENAYSVLVVLLVIVAVSVVGASAGGHHVLTFAFACFCTVAVTFAMTIVVMRQLLHHKVNDGNVGLMQARARSLQQLRDSASSRTLVENVMARGLADEKLHEKRAEVRTVKKENRDDWGVKRNVYSNAFFTIFGLTSVVYVLAAGNGQLSGRLMLLFIFAMVGVWGAISYLSDKSSSLIEAEQDGVLEGLEKGLSAIEFAESQLGAPLQVKLSTPLVPRNGEITFHTDESSGKAYFSYGGPNSQIRYPKPALGDVKLPYTVTETKVMRVLGRKNSGSTLLLKTLAGKYPVRAGRVEIGGVDLAEVGPAIGEWVKLVEQEIPSFDGNSILDIFKTFVCENITEDRIWTVLGLLGLKDQIEQWQITDADTGHTKASGVQVMIGRGGRHLKSDSLRLLWFAVHFEAMRMRLSDAEFKPVLILLDGVHLLSSRSDRARVVHLFEHKLLASPEANHLQVTLIATALHHRDVELWLKGNNAFKDQTVLALHQPSPLGESGEVHPDDVVKDCTSSVLYVWEHLKHKKATSGSRYKTFYTGVGKSA